MDWTWVLAILSVALLSAGLVCVSALLGAAFGAFVGWILSLTFLGSWVESGFAVFGINATGSLMSIGAMLGFVAGFFKVTVSKKGG